MIVTLYVTLVGLIIGSAINAIVWRLYVGRSWAKGRSECPECHHKLAGRDLVPVLSWLALRGRCRYCATRIHWQYPVVEAVTALVFGVSAAVLAPVAALDFVGLAIWLFILTLLVILAVYDLRWMLLPNKVMLPLVVAGFVLALFNVVRLGSLSPLWGSLAAAAVAGGGFYLIALVTKGKAMGGGDIKLAFAMGLILGAQATAVAMELAFLVAAIVAVALVIARRKGRRSLMPFGPFLAGATVVAYLWGRGIVDWYLRINGLG